MAHRVTGLRVGFIAGRSPGDDRIVAPIRRRARDRSESHQWSIRRGSGIEPTECGRRLHALRDRTGEGAGGSVRIQIQLALEDLLQLPVTAQCRLRPARGRVEADQLEVGFLAQGVGRHRPMRGHQSGVQVTGLFVVMDQPLERLEELLLPALSLPQHPVLVESRQKPTAIERERARQVWLALGGRGGSLGGDNCRRSCRPRLASVRSSRSYRGRAARWCSRTSRRR